MKPEAPALPAYFEAMVSAAEASSHSRALLLLADQAFSYGRADRAVAILEKLLASGAADRQTALRAQDRLAQTVPGYHVRMIRDHRRNRAFEAAICRAVSPATRVLDVGSGTGLLAMMAARAGARHVVTCEANPTMANVAREIVRRNGFADRVSVVPKHSSALDLVADLGGPADLVVAEIIGSDLVDEGVLNVMRDVARRLAGPGTRFIPHAGDIRLALAWWDGLADRPMQTECGFDMGALNRLLPARERLQVGDPGLFIRSEDISLFSFDFTSPNPIPEQTERDLVAQGGPVNGVVEWLRLHMDEAETFENRPAHGAQSHWACSFFPFERPINPARGEAVRVAASHAGDRLYVWQAGTPSA